MSNLQHNINIVSAQIPYDKDPHAKKEYDWVGRRGCRLVDGFDKASGRAIFPRDTIVPGMLYARVLSCPHAHAVIKSMDTSEAEAMEGVRYILRYDDPNPAAGFYVAQIGYFEGELMGVAIAADTEDIAEEALRKVKIEWQVLPFALECEDSIVEGMPILKNFHAIKVPGMPADTNHFKGTSANQYLTDWHLPGDVDEGFQNSDQIVEFTWRREENISAVPCWASLAVWGNMRNNQSSEGPVTQLYNYRPGNFGAGFLAEIIPSGIAPMLASYTGKNVICVQTPRAAHNCFCADDSGTVKCKVGFNSDGTIVAVQIDPWYFNRTYQSGIQWLHNSTKIPNLGINYNGAYVNRPINLPNRSEQRPNTSTYDMVIAHVAAALEMDPSEVARKNNGFEGHDLEWLAHHAEEHGFTWVDSQSQCINTAKEAIDWDANWSAKPGAKTLPNGNLQGLGFSGGYLNWHSTAFASDVGLSLDSSGKVHIISKQNEYGSNHNTTYCHVVAEELGCKYEDVHLRPNHQYDSFHLFDQGGSGGCAVNTHAVAKAARVLKPQILELACLEHTLLPTNDGSQELDGVYGYDRWPLRMTSLFPGLNPEDLDIKDSMVFEKANPDNAQPLALVASRTGTVSSGRHAGIPFGFAFQGQGIYGDEHDRPEMSRMCNMSLIEVDPETGQIIVKKSVAVNDVGKIIQPESCEGQIYGAAIMGIGRQILEEAIYDPATGVKLNDNLIEYKWPTLDYVQTVEAHPLENELGYGAYGCTGVGENQSDCAGQSITSALYNATGKWVLDWPMTPDKVLKALGKA